MLSPDNRMISLPAEQANYIDTLVASGRYATASEVVRAGLRALQERDSAVERWLQNEVGPVAAAMQADPGRAIPAERVFANLRALHAHRLKDASKQRGRSSFRPKRKTTFTSFLCASPSGRAQPAPLLTWTGSRASASASVTSLNVVRDATISGPACARWASSGVSPSLLRSQPG